MVYCCDRCRFLFERFSEPENCPDCGSFAVHPADTEEQQEYKRHRETAASEEWWRLGR